MRLFRHFCFFRHSLIRNGKAKFLMFKTVRKYGSNIKLRSNYDIPGFNLLIGKFAFSRVATKILNSYLDSLLNLSLNSLIIFFDLNMLYLFDKHLFSFFFVDSFFILFIILFILICSFRLSPLTILSLN